MGTTLVIRSLIQKLAASGRIVIYSSHELEMVERVCSEVMILREGRVAAHAPTVALRQQVNAASLEDAFRAIVFTTDVLLRVTPFMTAVSFSKATASLSPPASSR